MRRRDELLRFECTQSALKYTGNSEFLVIPKAKTKEYEIGGTYF